MKTTRGKTYEEIYGSKEGAKKEIEKRAVTHKKTWKKKLASGNFRPWNKGLTKETDERVRKQGKAISRGLKNSNYIVWNKGLTKYNHPGLEKLSKSMRGKNKGKNSGMYGKKSKGKGRSRQGYRKDLEQFFRSSWEANLARVFNLLGIKWLFESQSNRCYFPNEDCTFLIDFYLPDEKLYIEVSGHVSEDKKKKLRLVKKYYPERQLVHITGKEYEKYFLPFHKIIKGWEKR